jgi:DNA polymerase III alpha subunit
MFDLFGDTAPVPLPELEMIPSDVSDREKASWEKELIGVSFSEKLFNPVFSGKEANALFCGNITTDMDKQAIVTAGRVISARYSLTKKNESFSIVVIEDISGQVEVIAWPKVYERDETLWTEGNELIVRGKVRIREDEVTLICDGAEYYHPPQEEEEPESMTEVRAPEPVKAEVKAPPTRQWLVIDIVQTADKDEDIARLNDIMTALKTFPGNDEIRLNVLNGGAPVPLKLPNVRADFCPELGKMLSGLVGEDGFRVEKLV